MRGCFPCAGIKPPNRRRAKGKVFADFPTFGCPFVSEMDKLYRDAEIATQNSDIAHGSDYTTPGTVNNYLAAPPTFCRALTRATSRNSATGALKWIKARRRMPPRPKPPRPQNRPVSSKQELLANTQRRILVCSCGSRNPLLIFAGGLK